MSGARYAIAAGRFYQDVAERLVAGAREVLEAGGAEGIDVLDVPGGGGQRPAQGQRAQHHQRQHRPGRRGAGPPGPGEADRHLGRAG